MPRKYSGKPVRVRESKNAKASSKNPSKARQSARIYKIRYGVLPAKALSNLKLIPYHPGYGNPIGEHGSKSIRPTEYRYKRLNEESGFYIKLEESMKKEGCINPLHALSIKEGTYSIYGTSRLWIAQELDIEVPVIITDFVDRWTDLEELYTKEDVLAKFQDWPETLVIDDDRMRMYGCKHVHLPDSVSQRL